MIDVLVTGAGGTLGSVLMRVLRDRGVRACGLISTRGPVPYVGDVSRVDLTDPRTYRDHILQLAPRAIVHLAAISKPAQAHANPELAHTLNIETTAVLTELSAQLGARLLYASTDMVFDGEHGAPYSESDTPDPGTYYGRTKLAGESYALTYHSALVARLPLLYGLSEATREPTFFENMLVALREGHPVSLFEDEVRTPLWLEDAAHALSQLVDSPLTGVVHVAGPEAVSRLHMGEQLAAAMGCSPASIVRSRRADHPSEEPRPGNLSLHSGRYVKHFGQPPGRPLHSTLPVLLARAPERRSN